MKEHYQNIVLYISYYQNQLKMLTHKFLLIDEKL
jgi:hypothetical protein